MKSVGVYFVADGVASAWVATILSTVHANADAKTHLAGEVRYKV